MQHHAYPALQEDETKRQSVDPPPENDFASTLEKDKAVFLQKMEARKGAVASKPAIFEQAECVSENPTRSSVRWKEKEKRLKLPLNRHHALT